MSTYTETIDLPHGYTAEIAVDQDPCNPFTEWDCEMPVAVFSDSRRYEGEIENYGGTLDLETLLELVPDDLWKTREGKRRIMQALDISPRSAAEWMRQEFEWHGSASFVDCVASFTDRGAFSSWGDYFEAMEAVANLAGVPCWNAVSCGYSQGDYANVFAAALPSWVERVGAPADDPENLRQQCRATVELWSAWAWGDVYGVRAIFRPNGEELNEGSCGGFYGSDHEKSGLLDHCVFMVGHDRTTRRERAATARAAMKRERAAAHDAACRDIPTVAFA